jgi:hypothetical protein
MLIAAAPAFAVDHNNVDADRPLSFEDAEAIAFGERSIEGGMLLRVPQGRPVGLQAHLEFLYGFALNSHISVAASPSIGGRADSESTSFDLENISVGVFHNINREYNGTPAFSLRGDLFLPTGHDASGVGFRIRGVMSKAAGQYGRLHVNIDLNVEPGAGEGDREFQPGLILGYSRPLGYPRRFTRTGLAELGVRAGSQSGTGPVILAGIGLRQQVTVRSVFDAGLESEIAGFDAASRDSFLIRFIVGYSTGY